MAKLVGLFALLLASANAFAPQSAVLRASTRSASVSMTTEVAQTSRRAMLASALLLVPAAANAMVVPGLNAPGLVKAKPQTGPRPEFAAIRDKTNFWSSKGVRYTRCAARALPPPLWFCKPWIGLAAPHDCMAPPAADLSPAAAVSAACAGPPCARL